MHLEQCLDVAMRPAVYVGQQDTLHTMSVETLLIISLLRMQALRLPLRSDTVCTVQRCKSYDAPFAAAASAG